MSHYLKAFSVVFDHEGGYVHDPDDKGGATNYGISLRFLRLVNIDVNGDGHVDKEDIAGLLPDEARDIYKIYFWDHYQLERVVHEWPAVKAFDMFVNMRGRNAAKILQRACCACGMDIEIDGILGSQSFGAINVSYELYPDKFKESVRHYQSQFYRDIVKKDISQSKFLKGWLNRARF